MTNLLTEQEKKDVEQKLLERIVAWAKKEQDLCAAEDEKGEMIESIVVLGKLIDYLTKKDD